MLRVFCFVLAAALVWGRPQHGLLHAEHRHQNSLDAVPPASTDGIFFYIAPTGNDDTGAGTLQSPWQTLERARTAVRLVNQGMKSDITVYLRAGAYYVASTFELAAIDSGYNGFSVKYAAYPNEEATVHAGVAFTGWQRVDAVKNIWAATLPLAVKDTRQVYLNGYRMTPTNTGAGIPGKAAVTGTGYTTSDSLAWAFLPEQEQSDIEFLYTGQGSSWTECRARVQSVTSDSAGVTITMQQPGFTTLRNKPFGQAPSFPASISNVFALLSAATPGQYYFNSRTRIVYYVPRPQDDMSTAVGMVPSLDVLIRLQGDETAQPLQPVRFITFDSLTFAYTSWLQPNQGMGYASLQSGFLAPLNDTGVDYEWYPVPGNIQLNTAENITIRNCLFTHMGATALVVDDASQSIQVTNNTFRDVSCGGIYVGQVNDVNTTDPTRENGHVLIANNFFDNIPVEFRDCAALLGGFMVNTTFTQNSIVNCSNTGISLGWGWSRDEASNANNNIISNNYVFGSNWLLVDGGSIYVLGPQPNSVMSGNYVSHQRQLYGALYTDEGSAYWHITRNVVNECPEWLHIWTPSIHDEVVDYCWSNQRYQDVHGTNITISNIVFLDPGQPFPDEAQQVMNNAGVSWMQGPKP